MDTDPEYFRILRSLLPFLDFPIQKHCGILLKILELQKTMEYYQQPALAETLHMTPQERSRKMLDSLLNSCPPDKRGMMNMMLNTMQTMAPAAAPQAETDLTSELKKDLTPEQQGMFDMLSNMLGGITL